MLTDGKGLNGGLVWSHDGRRVAYHSTARDGVSYDLYIAEPAGIAPPRLVFNGFQKNWSVEAWSPDDTKLLIRNFVSANESHLFVMDIATAALTPVSEGPEPASVSDARFSRGWPRRLSHHQPRQRVRAAAACGPGDRRRRSADRPHSLGHRQLRAQRRRPLSRLGGERRRRQPPDRGRRGEARGNPAAACRMAASAASASIRPASAWPSRWRARSRRATCTCSKSSATPSCATPAARRARSIRCSSCPPS